jgi:hypothetical protein
MKHLRNRSKTTKNPDENPDLPMVSKNLKKNISQPKFLSNVCDFQKES